jgi:hypothetical protein
MRRTFAILAKVDITDVDRIKLLKVLWEQQPPALFYSMCPEAKIPEWDEEKAKEVLKHGYIDYFQGRCIKTNLTNNFTDSWDYNESGGPTFEDALDKVKSKN